MKSLPVFISGLCPSFSLNPVLETKGYGKGGVVSRENDFIGDVTSPEDYLSFFYSDVTTDVYRRFGRTPTPPANSNPTLPETPTKDLGPRLDD